MQTRRGYYLEVCIVGNILLPGGIVLGIVGNIFFVSVRIIYVLYLLIMYVCPSQQCILNFIVYITLSQQSLSDLHNYVPKR